MSFLSYSNLRTLSIFRSLKFSFVDLIVLVSYYLFCLLLFLSLAGLFKKEFISLGLVVGFLFFLLIFYKRVVFQRYYLYFFLLVPIFFVGVLLFLGSFDGDAVNYWLPLSREIVLQQKMPDFLLNNPMWITSREPLMPLFFAGVFSFLGFKASLATILLLFFIAATVLLLYQWAREKGINKKYIFFVVLLVLVNPVMMKYGGNLHQEAFILFFFTAFFYYLEKYQKTNSQFYLFLVFLSFVLAVASKFTGLVLVLPLAWLIVKNRSFKKPLFYLFLFSLPLIICFVRNYIIYDNPVFPFFNNIFKGEYYKLVLAVNQSYQPFFLPFWSNILTRLATAIPHIFLVFCPFGILSFYGFWKKRKIQYFFLSLVFFLAIFLVAPSLFASSNYDRYLLPFLGLLVIYALVGLEEIKSRVFLSSIFFINLWGLLSTKVYLSQSKFLSPVEGSLAIFSQTAQFIYDYRLILAVILGLFFYFFISHKSYSKYLIILLICSYLVKSVVVQIGSWLNVWLPILFLLFIILAWRFFLRFKEETLKRLVIAYIIVLLILNSWGLASLYFLAYRQIAFPNFREIYGILPQVAEELEELEGKNRDFYVYVPLTTYLNWYHNYKEVEPGGFTFYLITNSEYREDLTAPEIHDLFQRSNIKYIVENIYRPPWQIFFDKIKSRPDLFEPILEEEGGFLWRIKS